MARVCHHVIPFILNQFFGLRSFPLKRIVVQSVVSKETVVLRWLIIQDVFFIISTEWNHAFFLSQVNSITLPSPPLPLTQ